MVSTRGAAACCSREVRLLPRVASAWLPARGCLRVVQPVGPAVWYIRVMSPRGAEVQRSSRRVAASAWSRRLVQPVGPAVWSSPALPYCGEPPRAFCSEGSLVLQPRDASVRCRLDDAAVMMARQQIYKRNFESFA